MAQDKWKLKLVASTPLTDDDLNRLKPIFMVNSCKAALSDCLPACLPAYQPASLSQIFHFSAVNLRICFPSFVLLVAAQPIWLPIHGCAVLSEDVQAVSQRPSNKAYAHLPLWRIPSRGAVWWIHHF